MAQAPQEQWTRRQWMIRAVIFIIALICSVMVLRAIEPTPQVQHNLAAKTLLRKQTKDLDKQTSKWLKNAPGAPKTLDVKLVVKGQDAKALTRDLQKLKVLKVVPDAKTTLTLTFEPKNADMTMRAVLSKAHAKPHVLVKNAKQRMGDWMALLPPLIAVLIALCFKRLIAALLCAVWIGAAIQVSFLPHKATWMAISKYVVGTTLSAFNLYVILFTISLVGMVHVMMKMGGLAGLLAQLSKVAKGAKSTRFATALMGAAIFFDDYANTVVVGSTMRPLSDARRISREKLAYLVDSTSAPIAGLAIISTWIGYEVGLFKEMSDQLGMGVSGYAIFFDILPLRFYCILTLCFVLLNTILGRDFGPMLKAERRASTGEVLREGSQPLTQVSLEHIEPDPDAPKRWYNAVIPVFLVIVCVLLGMFWSGWSAKGMSIPSVKQIWQDPKVDLAQWWSAWSVAIADMGSWTGWRDAFSNADGAFVLCVAALVGSGIAIFLARSQKLLTIPQATLAWGRAFPGMWMAVTILILAWSIRSVCDDLGTSLLLVGSIQDLITPQLLPALTFGLAAIVAFATGTSWGTMGILLPTMIPLAFYMTQGMAHGHLLLMLCFGAVLDGAIFGDHCSPISDTTVMSSISSACDHLDHVKTQIPYAVTTMSMGAGFGYVGVAYGLSPWLAYGLSIISLGAILMVVGKQSSVNEPAQNPHDSDHHA